MLAIWESYVAVIFHHDTVTARRLGARRALAGSLGEVDLEMLAQASLGFATVCEGNVAEGCASWTRPRRQRSAVR